MNANTPARLDLKRDEALTIEWADGSVSRYPIAYLRRLSPSADQRELRKAIRSNPLTVLPSSPGGEGVVANGAELVGNYAIKIHFSDGHNTGLYTWEYLREIDPARAGGQVEGRERAPGDEGPRHDDPLGLG